MISLGTRPIKIAKNIITKAIIFSIEKFLDLLLFKKVNLFSAISIAIDIMHIMIKKYLEFIAGRYTPAVQTTP